MHRCVSVLLNRPPWAVRGVALVAALCFVACASSLSCGRRSMSVGQADSLHAEWVHSPPEGCVVGVSGPTLNPRNAIRNARFSAIERLAADSLSVDVQSMTGVGPYGSFEVSAQALSGSLANARIVSIWSETEPEAAREPTVRRLKWVYALACWPSAVARGTPRLTYPDWLIDPVLAAESEEMGQGERAKTSIRGMSRNRICAVGIAGPTWKRADQAASALRDARRALAVAFESRIEKRIFDDGHGTARILREVEPSSAALARADEATALIQGWYDERGDGPIGLAGVLYGLVCIPG